jgi:pentatricopeptide repeat protein
MQRLRWIITRNISIRETRYQQKLVELRKNPYKKQEPAPKVDPRVHQLNGIYNTFQTALKDRDAPLVQNYLKLLKNDVYLISSSELADCLFLLIQYQKPKPISEQVNDLSRLLFQLVERHYTENITPLFEGLFHLHLKLQDGKRMESLLELMILNKVPLSHKIIELLLKQYSKHGPVESAEKLVTYAIQTTGTIPVYFEFLVDAYGNAARPWQSMHVLKLAEDQGHPLDSILQRVIHAFAVNGETRGMYNVWKLMKEKKIQQNTISYNMMISGYKKAGKFQRGTYCFIVALDFFHEMKKASINNENIKPDAVTFSILIDMYCKTSDPDSAADILDNMIREKQQLTRYYFNSVMDAYRKQCNKEKVLHYYNLMQERGLEVHEDTFNILISMYGNLNDLNSVHDLLENMQHQRILLTRFSIATIMRLFYNHKKYEKVAEWYSKLKIRGMFPNESILETMMRSSLAQGMDLETCLIYYDIAKTLNIVQLNLLHQNLIAHIASDVGLDKSLQIFLNELEALKLNPHKKTLYLVLDAILSRSTFLQDKLYPPEVIVRDTNLIPMPGKEQFEMVIKEIRKHVIVPDRLEKEIEEAAKVLNI